MPFSHPDPSLYPASTASWGWGLHPWGPRMTSVIPVIPSGGGEGLLPMWAALHRGPHCLPSCSDQGSPPAGGAG